jgi:hypothetical protein
MKWGYIFCLNFSQDLEAIRFQNCEQQAFLHYGSHCSCANFSDTIRYEISNLIEDNLISIQVDLLDTEKSSVLMRMCDFIDGF